MAVGYYGVTLNIDGMSLDRGAAGPVTRTADHSNKYEVVLPVAKALTSWVKVDANTAGGNLASGHGWTSGKFDVYWTGGRKYDADGIVTVDALALDLGTGDDYPESADVTVRVMKHQTINTQLDGDAIALGGIKLEFAAASTERGHVHFEDVDAHVITDLDLAANIPLAYDITGGDTNVFTGDPIAKCYATQSSTTLTCTLKIATIEDSTP